MKKKAIIFDLDGTLSDSIQSIQYSIDKTLKPFGYGPFTLKQCCYFVGDGASNLVKRALIASGDSELRHYEEAFASYRKIFQENCMYQVKPYDGIPALLHTLKKRAVKIAVLSNKPHQESIKVVTNLFGNQLFDCIQGQIDGVPIKPDPAGVFQILKVIDTQPEETLYLGDTATDMKTGKAAGLLTIGALWGFRDRTELENGGADSVIAHPLDILNYFQEN